MVISENRDNDKPLIERFRIKNFLSLRDVVLPLKPLTILVGPNGSEKSNIIKAFSLLPTVSFFPTSWRRDLAESKSEYDTNSH